MPARVELTWVDSLLKWGPWVLGEIEHSTATDTWRYRIGTRPRSSAYQSAMDCAQDLESEVRSLLKEAGVEVEP